LWISVYFNETKTDSLDTAESVSRAEHQRRHLEEAAPGACGPTARQSTWTALNGTARFGTYQPWRTGTATPLLSLRAGSGDYLGDYLGDYAVALGSSSVDSQDRLHP
jgi:hypothetical protein